MTYIALYVYILIAPFLYVASMYFASFDDNTPYLSVVVTRSSFSNRGAQLSKTHGSGFGGQG